tara:strand:+ start:1963 stop:2532 length:570 start_codon:yes stop_codon:yes gene_type:complete
MATDYRFALLCWQDQAGSENAKANVYVDGVQVMTEAEVTKTSPDDPDYLLFELIGGPDVADSASVDIKVELANEYYVDENTDRNIHIGQIGYIDKKGDNYISNLRVVGDGTLDLNTSDNTKTVTDFTVFADYYGGNAPSAVTGDQIPTDFLDDRTHANEFKTVTVWGGDTTGVTMVFPLNTTARFGDVD